MRNITFILLVFTIISCKTIKTLGDYGVLDKRHICSNENYNTGDLILKIGDYELIFDYKDFEKELESYERETLTDYLKIIRNIYSNQNNSITIYKINEQYIINGTEVKLDQKLGIDISLDILYKSEKFHLVNSKNIKCMDYEHWYPHKQGTIYSKWIIDEKVINEIIFGFID
jgi:hypothetical protein